MVADALALNTITKVCPALTVKPPEGLVSQVGTAAVPPAVKPAAATAVPFRVTLVVLAYVKPAGKVSVTFTPVAFAVPLLVTVTV